ncbi:MAG TPA: tetratricopeptide repeat protein [Terriglobales bacterium]|jgi:tetratricopeptide (TPR) repeat protein
MRRDIQLGVASLIVSTFLLAGASAQQSGGSGGKASLSKAPARVNPNPTGPSPTTYYMGKVVVDTGMPPPASVAVLRICNGMSRRETFTSGDGSFSFMVGNLSNGALPDASDDTRQFGTSSQLSRNNPFTANPNSPEATIADCELRADLAGYTSSSIRLDNSMTNSNVGVIVLHSRSKKSDGMVSVASLQVPQKARKEYEKGSESLEKGNLADAEKSLRKAIDLYPKFAEAWLRLGDVEERQKNTDGAMADYQKAIDADGNFALPYLRMAYLYALASNWEQTRNLTERVNALDPVNFPLAYYYNAVAEFNLNNIARAETNALRAASLDKLHSEPGVELLLATLYKSKGDPASAADHYRTYLKLVPDGPLSQKVKADLAKTEQLAKSQSAKVTPVNK